MNAAVAVWNALLMCLAGASAPGSCPASDESHPGLQDPSANHLQLAIAADERGDFEASLAYFRAAVRFNRTPFNMANLGVCLMRFAIRGQGHHYLKPAIEYLHEAKQSGLPHAVQNWEHLVDSYGKMGYDIPRKYLELHESASLWERPELLHQRSVPPAPPLPRIPVSELPNPGNEQYMELRVPFVLTGAMDGWKALSWNLTELAARYIHCSATVLSCVERSMLCSWPKAVADFHPFNMLDR